MRNLCFVLLFFTLNAAASSLVEVRGSLVADSNSVRIRGVVSDHIELSKNQRLRLEKEGIVFKLWSASFGHCKSVVARVPIEYLKWAPSKLSLSDQLSPYFLASSDVDCFEYGMPSWDKDYLLSCKALGVQISRLKGVVGPLDQAHILKQEFRKYRNIFDLKNCSGQL